jgi:hypothetical protein
MEFGPSMKDAIAHHPDLEKLDWQRLLKHVDVDRIDSAVDMFVCHDGTVMIYRDPDRSIEWITVEKMPNGSYVVHNTDDQWKPPKVSLELAVKEVIRLVYNWSLDALS